MSIWNISPSNDPAKYEVEQELRTEWFDKIMPVGNWKCGIDCWIEADDFEQCDNAAIWFTGAGLRAIESRGSKVRVIGPGYYATIGA
jgi:hypothetical protein